MMEDFNFSVDLVEEKEDWGQMVISPLPNGFGDTVGNSLRRVLLGYLPGAAVTQVKVKGASHLFSTLDGVKEDLVEIVLNLKQIRFKYQGEEPITLKLEKKGVGKVKAGDFQAQPGIEVANPGLVLANLTDKKSNLKMEIVVACGIGYQMAEEHESSKLGVIGIDSAFTPIRKVNYQTEPVRKGKKDTFEELKIDIWTDGSLKPSEALNKASEILMKTFRQVFEPQSVKSEEESKPENHDLDLLIEEIEDIPLRLTNALKKAGYKKLSDLVEAGEGDVVKAKNVGAKSIILLKKVLKEKGIELK